MKQPLTTRGLVLFGALILILVMLILGGGCSLAKDLDRALWQAPPAPDGTPAPVETVPPIVQTVAAIAATLGFGGMSAWVHRANKKAANGNRDLAIRLSELETRIIHGPPDE